MGDNAIDVSGGTGGITAIYDDMLTYAGVIDAAGDGMRDTGGRVSSMAVSGDLAQALVLCPAEVATAEAAIIAAATGPSGALWTGSELEISARYLRTSVDTYRFMDAKLSQLADLGQDAAGFALGLALPGLAVLGGLGYLGVTTNPRLSALLDQMGVEAPTAADLQETIYDNPWLAESLTRMAPTLVQGTGLSLASLLGPQGLVALAAASGGNWPTTDYPTAISGLLALAGLGGALRDEGDFTVDRVPGEPRTLDLSSSNMVSRIFEEQGRLGDGAGQVQIIKIDHPGGDPSYVVQIPGTQEWGATRGDNPVDLSTNVNLMAMSGSTELERQVADAMAQAGIGPNDPVMLTGHSQGGITAASMASDPELRNRFHIDSVVTGGSPIGRFDIPDDVSVLSLEHDQDVVPMLDGTENPDRPNWVTVERTLSDAEGTINGQRGPGGAHSVPNYAATGSQIDSSSDASLARWREENQGFMNGTGDASRYQISRVD